VKAGQVAVGRFGLGFQLRLALAVHRFGGVALFQLPPPLRQVGGQVQPQQGERQDEERHRDQQERPAADRGGGSGS
jgi:hypothetical protein